MSRLRGARVRVKGGKGDRTQKGWGEVIRSDNLDWGLYNKNFSVWESSWTKQRGYIENKGVFVQAEQGSQGMRPLYMIDTIDMTASCTFTVFCTFIKKKMERCFLRAKCARAGEGRNFQ